MLDRLHELGLRLSIDHYGSGHSSLASLRRLPIDEVKIDQSFVTNLATGGDDAVIVRATIELAHNLGLVVVAEGVDDPTALDMLITYGCDGAQGDLIGRAGSAAELTALLAESPDATVTVTEALYG